MSSVQWRFPWLLADYQRNMMRTRKWWHRVFIFLTMVTTHNAYIITQDSNPDYVKRKWPSFKGFVEDLIADLTKDSKTKRAPPNLLQPRPRNQLHSMCQRHDKLYTTCHECRDQAPSPAVPVVGKGKGKSVAGRVTNVRPRVDTGESDDEELETAVEDPGPGPAGDLDEWRQVTTGATEHPIRFTPHRSPGVKEGVDTSTELKSLNLLSDDEVKDYLVNYINTFAAMKYQQNNPPKRYSVFSFLMGHSTLNRRGFPPQLKQQHLAHLESRYYMSSDDQDIVCGIQGEKRPKKRLEIGFNLDADISSAPTKKVYAGPHL
ncbi:hypothetical protein RRG08_060637 [Elysia crispata]|uniref:PiggyBac transposable element-derived protein domain-containing protein n=1 Tax=Elysia crispata TaxID=231223 RepID=A0AAE1D4L8_9GAST|nr:hypothetical protein RRG08_060637 [Elysia crispata]